MNRPPDVKRPGSVSPQPGLQSDLPGGRIKSNGNAIAKPAQHSRPDRYRLQVPPAWDVPGADAARLLDRLWNVRRRS